MPKTFKNQPLTRTFVCVWAFVCLFGLEQAYKAKGDVVAHRFTSDLLQNAWIDRGEGLDRRVAIGRQRVSGLGHANPRSGSSGVRRSQLSAA